MENKQKQVDLLFEINNLDFYFGSKQVLKNLSFSIKKGTVHGILGDNGAGKTTLFNLIFGILKTAHLDLSTLNKHNIAYLETEIYFYPYMTGREYVNLINQQATNDIDQWNQIFELPLNAYAHTYSTGMKKKLALLSILLLNKELIILDEPFNGLDLKTCEIINYIIQRLKNVGKTIILSSHILDTVIQNADEISFIENGAIINTYAKANFNDLTTLVRNKFKDNVVHSIDQLIL